MRNGPHDSPHDEYDSGSHNNYQRSERGNVSREPRQNRQPDPTPQWVYWVRRTVALAIVIAVLSLLGWGISAVVGLVTGDSKAPSDTSKSSSPAANKKDEAEKDSNGPKNCDPAAVELQLTADQKSVTVGNSMPLVVKLTNNGDSDCILDVSPTNTSVTVYSGQDRIWSNADCDESGTQALFMERRAKTSANVSWNGKRSNEACDSGLPAVKAGTYKAVATYKKTTSNELVFTVK